MNWGVVDYSVCLICQKVDELLPHSLNVPFLGLSGNKFVTPAASLSSSIHGPIRSPELLGSCGKIFSQLTTLAGKLLDLQWYTVWQ